MKTFTAVFVLAVLASTVDGKRSSEFQRVTSTVARDAGPQLVDGSVLHSPEFQADGGWGTSRRAPEFQADGGWGEFEEEELEEDGEKQKKDGKLQKPRKKGKDTQKFGRPKRDRLRDRN